MKNNGKYPVFLVILDGFGYREAQNGNAVAHANMPFWNKWLTRFPNILLNASGEAVGLPEGFMGNSEVGHTTLGAGRIVQTAFCKFRDAIEDGSFFENKMLIEYFEKLKESNKPLHVMGLLSDAGVHSHEEDLYAILCLAKLVGVQHTYIHAFLDGRDTPPKSAKKYLERLDAFCQKEQYGILASLHGRFYAMDRDKNLDRTKKSFDALLGHGLTKKNSWKELLFESYENNVTDEFFEPILLDERYAIQEGDGLFFFNFRPDRARQLTECFLKPVSLTVMPPKIACFISTTLYAKAFLQYGNDILFPNEPIRNTLLDVIADQKTHNKILVIAETEKYAHVTYFFHGRTEKSLSGEERVLVPSIKTRTYVDYPEMSAEKITARIIRSLRDDPAAFYLINYANCDMVGHSGNFDAAVKACECIDKQLGVLYKEVVENRGGTLFVTADHGNAEEMIDEAGNVKTSHTCNPVPFMVVSQRFDGKAAKDVFLSNDSLWGLCNIAPTVLTYIDVSPPKEMSCRSFGFVVS